MRFSRRSFLTAMGMTGAATLAGPMIGGRGREALAWGGPDDASIPRRAGALIRLDSNENPMGPGPKALKAIGDAFDVASRYPRAEDALVERLARDLSVKPEEITLGCGSTETLRLAVDAFVSRDRPLVTGLPSFETPASRAVENGAEVRAVPVDGSLRLDLDGMLARVRGAGLVFLCNPNNPTATVYSESDVRGFIAAVHRTSPETTVLVDEAYFDYVEFPGYATMIPLALSDPRVIVARTFSKAYGMAGLRIGYAVGRPETLEKMDAARLPMAISALSLAAATAVVGDRAALAAERARNTEARAFAVQVFQDAGCAVTPSVTNFFMAELGRDVRDFRAACRKRDVLVGRPFPPLDMYGRISVGTLAEMRTAAPVFREALREISAGS